MSKLRSICKEEKVLSYILVVLVSLLLALGGIEFMERAVFEYDLSGFKTVQGIVTVDNNLTKGLQKEVLILCEDGTEVKESVGVFSYNVGDVVTVYTDGTNYSTDLYSFVKSKIPVAVLVCVLSILAALIVIYVCSCTFSGTKQIIAVTFGMLAFWFVICAYDGNENTRSLEDKVHLSINVVKSEDEVKESIQQSKWNKAYDAIEGNWLSRDGLIFLNVYEEDGIAKINYCGQEESYVIKPLYGCEITFLNYKNVSKDGMTVVYDCINEDGEEYSSELDVNLKNHSIMTYDGNILYSSDIAFKVEKPKEICEVYKQFISELPELEELEGFNKSCEELMKRGVTSIKPETAEIEECDDGTYAHVIGEIRDDGKEHIIFFIMNKDGSPDKLEQWFVSGLAIGEGPDAGV